MKNARILTLVLLILTASHLRAWGADEKSDQDMLNCPSQTWHMYMPDVAAAHTYDRNAQFNHIQVAAMTGSFDDDNYAQNGPNDPFLIEDVQTHVEGTGAECNSETNKCGDSFAAAVVAGVYIVSNHCVQDVAQALALRKSFFEKAKSIPGLQIDCEAKPNERLLKIFCGPIPAPRLSGGS